MNIPVVLIHKGYQDYLGCTLQQANKNNDVYLLGDTKPPFNSPTIKFQSMSDYFGECDEFRGHYQPLEYNTV